MKRILQVFGEPLANGGQETFIMNMYRNIDREKIQFDFFTPYYCNNEKLVQEINMLGGRVYEKKGRFDTQGNKKDFIKNLKEFLNEKKYEIVHIHSGSIFSLAVGAKIAKKSGTKKVIVHSHCGGFDNLKYRMIKTLSTHYMIKYPTRYYACSQLAAEWKFPPKIIKEKKYTILKNAVDTSKVFYSSEIRDSKRKELGLEKKFVIGHIGRFSTQKNHSFLVDIFNEIQKDIPDSVLLLIGVGELQEEIKVKVEKLRIKEKVIFLNLRNDIQDLLNAMDVFVLPSFFEGLPVVAVEAQATGLQVFTSTGVTKELPIEKLSYYYSIDDGVEIWKQNIIEEYKKYQRINTTELIKESGYDVKIAAKRMQELYIDIMNGE